MKPDTPRSDLEIARATIAAAITRNASGIAAAVKPPAPFAREADYYEDWRTYWADIVAPFGEINLDQVQRELSDYGRLLDAVPLVYMHATGGQVSKPLTDPSVVCSLIDDHVGEIVEEAVKDSEALQRGPGAIPAPHVTASQHIEQYILEGLRDRLSETPRGAIKGNGPQLTAGVDVGADRLTVEIYPAPPLSGPPNIRKSTGGAFSALTELARLFGPLRPDRPAGFYPDLPPGSRIAQHPDDAAVDRFAAAMKAKLAAGRAKGRHGWNNPAAVSDAELAALMTQHMTKGNPGTFEDVANFCMMLHQRGAHPATLASAAFYAPQTNFQRNTLLAAMKEVREALQAAVKPPRAAITDTVWMPGRPETLFDFIDATLEGLVEWHAPGARNMLYEGLFDGESEEDRTARLDLAHHMTQTALDKLAGTPAPETKDPQ